MIVVSVHKYNKILTRAKQCKKSVEQTGRLGVNVGWSYYFAKIIVDGKKDINKKKFSLGKTTSKNKYHQRIKKDDYLKLAKRLIKVVESEKRLPNAMTFNKKHLGQDDYTFLFARLVVYLSKKNSLPSDIGLNSNIFKEFKKYGHATSHCCDEMGQNTGYYCGCHSLQEVIRNLTGKVISQSKIASIAGTTTDGTDHNGLNTVIAWFNREYGYNLKVEWFNFSDLGWNGLKKIINSNNQDAIIHNLYRNQFGHYEVINKIYDSYCLVQNSLGSKCDNGCYYGYVEERSLSEYRSYISGISQKSIMVITND